MKTQKMFSTLMGIVAVVTMTSMLWAGAASAAPAGIQIKINAQDLNTGEVMVDSVTAAQPGWIGIFKDPTATPDALVGYAPVSQGVDANFTVDIDTNRVGSAPTLYAELLVDQSGTGMFDVNTIAPATGTPIVGFATEAAQAAAPMAPAPVVQSKTGEQIKIKAQDLTVTGQIVVDSVVAAQAGWLGIYKSAGLTPDELVGFVPVQPGQNTNLMVDINSNRVGDTPTLWAQLLTDPNGWGVFDANAPIDSNTPVVAFATQAAQ
jgi:hypothetical protein